MTVAEEFERARQFAKIFNGAGAGWRQYVPDDCVVSGNTVWMGQIRMDLTLLGWVLLRPGRHQDSMLIRPMVPT